MKNLWIGLGTKWKASIGEKNPPLCKYYFNYKYSVNKYSVNTRLGYQLFSPLSK